MTVLCKIYLLIISYCIFSLNPLLQNLLDQVLELDIADHHDGGVFGLLVPGSHLQDGREVGQTLESLGLLLGHWPSLVNQGALRSL